MPPRAEASLRVPPSDDYIESASVFVLSYARSLEMPSEGQNRLKAALDAALALVQDCHLQGGSDEPVSIRVRESEGRLAVDILNRGTPVLLKETGDEVRISRFREAAKGVEKMSVENLGRRGQFVRLQVKVGRLSRSVTEERPVGRGEASEGGPITFRMLEHGEESALSRLFYFVYGYDYIHEAVYYPEKLKEMIEQGRLISMVAALPGGRLVGHVGLVRQNETPPVFEAALGVVDPIAGSRGVFSRLFEKTMERMLQSPMQYCYFDFVTNHDISQRLISRYGTCDMALLTGSQSRDTQVKLSKIGLGPDPEEMDRYSILLSVIPRVERPFGEEVSLPPSLGEPLEFLLRPLGLSWTPASRFQVLAAEGNYKAHYDPTQGAVLFDLFEPGKGAAEGVAQEWKQALKDGYRYAAVDVPVREPGLGAIYDLLSTDGFFIAGFIPYHFGDKLAFRFQSLGPAEAAFDKIKVSSPDARRLLEIVRSDYERNRLI
jgi:hypothetical protein